MELSNRDVDLDELQPHPKNYNRHPPEQVRRLAKSLTKFGQVRSVVVWRNTLLAGHGVVEAARILNWRHVRADVLPDDYPPHLALAYIAADNELARQGDPDMAQLAAILEESKAADAELLEAIGYSDQEFEALLAEVGNGAAGVEDADNGGQIDRAAELNEVWRVKPGDLWQIGQHRLVCGDCRDPATWARLLDGVKVNGVFTSPPYAEQRKSQYGGTPTAEYVDWWEAVQANVRAHLAPDGSFFVNIKPHCEDGERVTYVFDLVLAMKRRWGWRFVDEFCWVHGGTPMDVERRFKNGFEPVFHFAALHEFAFYPKSVRHYSDSVPGKYSEKKRGRIPTDMQQGVTGDIFANPDKQPGLAYPSNVVSVGKNTEALGQSAAFPVALPDFFIRAYSGLGDIWLDPFLGSGTTMVAAHNNKRIGMGSEMLPNYCAVILQRMQDTLGLTGELVGAT